MRLLTFKFVSLTQQQAEAVGVRHFRAAWLISYQRSTEELSIAISDILATPLGCALSYFFVNILLMRYTLTFFSVTSIYSLLMLSFSPDCTLHDLTFANSEPAVVYMIIKSHLLFDGLFFGLVEKLIKVFAIPSYIHSRILRSVQKVAYLS